MNAIMFLLLWVGSLFGGVKSNTVRSTSGIQPAEVQGVHIINNNPRTVVALEDTHFRPGR